MRRFKVYFLFCFLFILAGFHAQNPTYSELVSIIKNKSPNLDLSDKILAFNLWSVNDQSSRDLNQQFEKVAYTFQYARLKNGSKGTVVVSCNADDRSTAAIAFQKDGIRNAIAISQSDYPFLEKLRPGTNVVYDNTKQKIYANLEAGTVFKSYNQLFTR